MPEQMSNVTIEDARFLRRNFSGKEDQYNREGDRNFVVFLDPAVARVMEQDGWNVKWLQPRDGEEYGDDPTPILNVAVSFKGRPPSVTLVTTRNMTRLHEEDVSMLDEIDILKADMIIRPYHWEVNKNSGIKAYLQTLFVTMDEDPLTQKYNAQFRALDEVEEQG